MAPDERKREEVRDPETRETDLRARGGLVPSPWAMLHFSRPFQSGPPSLAISVLLLLRKMRRDERQKAIASGEIGRVLAARWIFLCFYGVWCAEVAVESRGFPSSSAVASCRCGGGFQSTPEPAVCGRGWSSPRQRLWAAKRLSVWLPSAHLRCTDPGAPIWLP